METATLSENHQIAIPKHLRDKLDLEHADWLKIGIDDGERLVFTYRRLSNKQVTVDKYTVQECGLEAGDTLNFTIQKLPQEQPIPAL